MSHATRILLLILFILIGVFLCMFYVTKPAAINTAPSEQVQDVSIPTKTTLSLSVNNPNVHPGQTVTVAVLIHNPNPHPTIAQLELAYDPQAVTIETITPGTFFVNPTIILQRINTNTGRISYALQCPSKTDCVNPTSPTVALITLRVNPQPTKIMTKLSFLPKTVIRTHTGESSLQGTSDLQLQITNQT